MIKVTGLVVAMVAVFLCTVAISAVFVSAAVYDVRTREVSDHHWILVWILGIPVSSAYYMECGVSGSMCALAGSILVMCGMFSDRVPGWIPVTLSFVFYGSCAARLGVSVFVSPATALFVLLLYRSGLVRGGADAKSLVVLALSYPVYPDIPGLPLLWDPVGECSLVLNPAVSVMTSALLLSLLPVPAILVRNIVSGYFGRGMLSTYSMSLAEAERSFVWPVQDAAGGRVVYVGVSEDPGTYRRLEEAGA